MLGINKITLWFFSTRIEQNVELPFTATGNLLKLCESCCDIVLEIVSSSFLRLAFLFSCADCASFLLVCDAFLLANTWQCAHFLPQPPSQHHIGVPAEETSSFTRFSWDEEQGDYIVIFYKLIFLLQHKIEKKISSLIFIKDFVKVSECWFTVVQIELTLSGICNMLMSGNEVKIQRSYFVA